MLLRCCCSVLLLFFTTVGKTLRGQEDFKQLFPLEFQRKSRVLRIEKERLSLKKLPHSKHLYKFQSISLFFLHFRHHSCWPGHLVYPHMLLPQGEHHEKHQRMETVISYPFGQKKNHFFTCQRTVTILRNLISYHVHIARLKEMKAAHT